MADPSRSRHDRAPAAWERRDASTNHPTLPRESAHRWLLLHHRCWRPSSGDRIGVTMRELPHAVLDAKDAGHAQLDRREVLSAADLGPVALHLDRVRDV